MKKYISYLSIAALLLAQSCERADSTADTESESLRPLNVVIKNENLTENSKNSGKEEEFDSTGTDTGDEKEPRKDKQHWRTANDTIR